MTARSEHPAPDRRNPRSIIPPSGARLLLVRLTDVPCIGPFRAARLARFNVRTTDDLVRLAARRAQRIALADAAGFREQRLRRWVQIADLLRLGMTATAAERMIDAGLAGTAALADADADRVAETADGEATREQAQRWVREARALAVEVE